MTSCPDQLAIEAFCDGDDGADSDEVAIHLQTCASCAKEAAQINWINEAVRQCGQSIHAPDSLTNWIDGQSDGRPVKRSLGRRNLIVAGSVAAGLGAVGVFFALPGGQPRMAPTLFDDFSTREAADRALDYNASSLTVVMDWFETRVPFDLPRLPGLTDIGLVGARLCWLLDRRVAAIHLDQESENACLYIADLAGLSLDKDREIPDADQPALITDGTAAGAFWRGQQLAFGLVASASTARVDGLMRRVYEAG